MTDTISQEHVNPNEVVVDTSQHDAAMGDVWEKAMAEGVEDDRPRGEDGKFTAVQNDDEPASLEGEEGAADKDPAATEQDQLGVEASAAPAHLPSAIKDSWKDIPEGARDALVALTRENDRKFSELGRQLETVRPISERLSHAIENFPEFRGLNATQLADGAVQLAAVQAKLERGTPESRAQTVLEIAQTYGVLPQLQAAITGQPASPEDTKAAALHQELQSLRAQVSNNAMTPEAIEERVQAIVAERESAALVERFAAEKPLFADVEEILPQFMEIAGERQPELQGVALLEAAYNMAINAIPEARAKSEALGAAKAATTVDADSKRAERAKTAASINVTSTSTGKTRPRSEDEAMGDVFDRLMAS